MTIRKLFNQKALRVTSCFKRIRWSDQNFWKRVIVRWIRLTVILGMLLISSVHDTFLASGVASSSALPPQNDQGDLDLSAKPMMMHPSAALLTPDSIVLDPPEEPELEDIFLAGESEEGIAVIYGDEVIYSANLSDEEKVIVVLKEDPVAVHLNRVRDEGEVSQAQLSADILAYATNLERERDEVVVKLQETGLIDQITRRFSYLVNGFTATVRLKDIPQIERWAEVQAVYFDEELHITLEQSVPLIGAPSVWAMTDGAGNPVTGLGITVAIIDTGIDYTHPDLGGCFGEGCKVIGGYDFVNGDSDPMDDHKHGTHVAGIVAANGTLKGVAPEAGLLAYKVCNLYGSCIESDVIAALERAADPDGDPLTDDQPQVINMSLSGPGRSDDPLVQATNRAVDQGIVVVVSAGNRRHYRTIGSPSMAEKALTVGATTKDDVMAGFSSKGPVDGYNIKPDLVAPGYSIKSAVLEAGYEELSGTSMAAPHVAGAAALMAQLHPEWSPERIKALLMNTAFSLGENVFVEGTGRIRIDQAANTTTVIQPAAFSLGRVDSSQAIWMKSETLELWNFGSSTMTYQMAVDSGLPPGVTAQLSSEMITINPGQSANISLTIVVDNSQLPYATSEPYAYCGSVSITNGVEQYRVPFAFVKNTQLKLRFDETPVYIAIHDRGLNDQGAGFGFPPLILEVPLAPGNYDVIVYYSGYSSGEGVYSGYVIREGVELLDEVDMAINRSDALYHVDARIKLLNGQEESAFPRDTYRGISMIKHQPSDYFIYTYGSLVTLAKTTFSPMSSAYTYEIVGFVQSVSDPSRFNDILYSFEGIQSDQHITYDLRHLKELNYSIRPLSDAPYAHVRYLITAASSDRVHFETFGVLEYCSNLPFQKRVFQVPEPSGGSIASHRYIEVYPMEDCSSDWPEERQIGETPFIKVEDERVFTTHAFNRELSFITELDRSSSKLYDFPLAPIFWSGIIKNEPEMVQIYSELSTANQKTSFLRDQWMNMFHYEVPYTLTVEGNPIQSGELGAEIGSDYWSSLSFQAGRAEMNLSYTAYLQGIPVEGVVTATFDTRQDDRNPPYIRALQILSSGKMTDMIAGEGQVRVEVIDDVELQTVELAIDLGDGRGWQSLIVSKQGDVFSADLGSIRPGDQVALRITAEDASGNRLVNEISPAFLGISQVFFPVVQHDTSP